MQRVVRSLFLEKKLRAARAKSMKLVDGLMIHSSQPRRINGGFEHILQSVLIFCKIISNISNKKLMQMIVISVF